MPGALVNIKTRIKNTGTSTLDSIPINYQIDGVTIANDLWTGTLYCSDSTEFSFIQQLTVPANDFTLCVRSNLISDSNLSNNEYCLNVVTGIETISSDDYLSLKSFPNPANNSTQIQFNLQQAGNCNAVIFNAYGDIVYSRSIAADSGVNTFSVDTSVMPDGVYFISVDDGKDRSTLRIVVIHG